MKPKEEKIYTRRAVYTGRRLNGKNVFQCFELLPEKKEMFFKGIRGVHLGYTYECTDSQMPVRARCVDVERIDNPEWEAADAIVDARNAEKRAASKMAATSKPNLKRALEVLRPLMRGLSYYDTRNLIEYLVIEAKKKK